MTLAREVGPTKPPYGPRRAQCAPEHATVKASEEQWAAMAFAGIHPLGPQLFEGRHCPSCDSTVLRPVTLARALGLLLDDLLSTSPPRHSSAHSAGLLIQWVAQNAPPTLGVEVPTRVFEAGKRACSR